MSKTKWEKLEQIPGSGGSTTLRLEVPGGWLYQVIEDRGAEPSLMALSFVPDPEHDSSLVRWLGLLRDAVDRGHP